MSVEEPIADIAVVVLFFALLSQGVGREMERRYSQLRLMIVSEKSCTAITRGVVAKSDQQPSQWSMRQQR